MLPLREIVKLFVIGGEPELQWTSPRQSPKLLSVSKIHHKSPFTIHPPRQLLYSSRSSTHKPSRCLPQDRSSAKVLPSAGPSLLPHRRYAHSSIVLAGLQRGLLTSLSFQLTKVAVLGAGGGIGQPLSLLMKLNPRVTELALYDIRGGPGPFIRSEMRHGTTD